MIPKHYRRCCGIIEPRHFLKMMPFQLGCACKYLLRAEYKGQNVSDYRKALDYLTWAMNPKEEPLDSKVWYLAKFFENEFINKLFETKNYISYSEAIRLVKKKIAELEGEPIGTGETARNED